MARGKETKFLTELKHSFNEQGCQAIKIGDVPMAPGLRFTTEKEFDMVVNLMGKFVAIEGKFMNSFKAFGINQMRENQIENLDKTVNTNGQAYVFLNVRFSGDKTLGTKRTNKLLIFEWEDLKKRWSNGSIKKKELESLKSIDGSKQRYSLKDFINGVRYFGGFKRAD